MDGMDGDAQEFHQHGVVGDRGGLASSNRRAA